MINYKSIHCLDLKKLLLISSLFLGSVLIHAQVEQNISAFPHQNLDSLQKVLEKERAANIEKLKNAKIQYLISRTENNGFGYYIFIDGQLYINQKTIPAIQGNHGFYSSEDAEKVAKFTIEKIMQGNLPPTLAVEEIKKLKITLPL